MVCVVTVSCTDDTQALDQNTAAEVAVRNSLTILGMVVRKKCILENI